MTSNTVGFIGGGNMAASLIGGLLLAPESEVGSDTFGRNQILVHEPNTARANWLEQQYGVGLMGDNESLVRASSVVVLAVKPQVLKQVLEPLVSAFSANQPLIVSIVAGITVGSINRWLQDEHTVVRAMPNTPALVSAGASGLYAADNVSHEQRILADRLLTSVGIVRWVEKEADIDAVTALSGSGPAYFMLFLENLIGAAIAAGIDPESATDLALQTARGSADLIASSDVDIGTLRQQVTSPNGTTEAALSVFGKSGLDRIVTEAFEAARTRAQEMAAEQQ